MKKYSIKGNDRMKMCVKSIIKKITKDNEKYSIIKQFSNKGFIYLFGGIYVLLALIILIGVLEQYLIKQTPRMVFVAIAYFGLFMILGILIKKYFTDDDTEKIDRIFYIGFVLMVIFMFISGSYLLCEFRTDMATVDKCAKRFLKYNSFEHIYDTVPENDKVFRNYFIRYENNRFIVLFLAGIYSVVKLIFGGIPKETVIDIGVVAIAVSVFLSVKIAKKAFGAKISLLTFIMIFLFLPFYTYVPYCYTDVLSMPFMMVALYYFIVLVKDKCSYKKKCICILLISFMLYFGYAMKGSVIVALLAFFIYYFMKKNIKKTIIFIAVTLSIFVGMSACLRQAYIKTKLIDTKVEKNIKFPYTHWIMMGLKGTGTFDIDDFFITVEQKTYEDKKEKNLEVIKERISDYGLEGMLWHIYEKLQFTWSDGTYYIRGHIYIPMYEGQSSFYRDLVVGKQDESKEEIERKDPVFILNDDCSKDTFLIISNGYQLFIVFALFLSVVIGFYKNKDDFSLLFSIMVFGITILLLLWETRSRYLFNFLPIMIILSANTIYLNSGFIYKRVYKKRKNK